MESAYSNIYGNAIDRTAAQAAVLTRAGHIIGLSYGSTAPRERADWDAYLQAADMLEAVGL